MNNLYTVILMLVWTLPVTWVYFNHQTSPFVTGNRRMYKRKKLWLGVHKSHQLLIQEKNKIISIFLFIIFNISFLSSLFRLKISFLISFYASAYNIISNIIRKIKEKKVKKAKWKLNRPVYKLTSLVYKNLPSDALKNHIYNWFLRIYS